MGMITRLIISAGPDEAALHSTRVSTIFLVRHGKLCNQPDCLLHHERQVCTFSSIKSTTTTEEKYVFIFYL